MTNKAQAKITAILFLLGLSLTIASYFYYSVLPLLYNIWNKENEKVGLINIIPPRVLKISYDQNATAAFVKVLFYNPNNLTLRLEPTVYIRTSIGDLVGYTEENSLPPNTTREIIIEVNDINVEILKNSEIFLSGDYPITISTGEVTPGQTYFSILNTFSYPTEIYNTRSFVLTLAPSPQITQYSYRVTETETNTLLAEGLSTTEENILLTLPTFGINNICINIQSNLLHQSICFQVMSYYLNIDLNLPDISYSSEFNAEIEVNTNYEGNIDALLFSATTGTIYSQLSLTNGTISITLSSDVYGENNICLTYKFGDNNYLICRTVLVNMCNPTYYPRCDSGSYLECVYLDGYYQIKETNDADSSQEACQCIGGYWTGSECCGDDPYEKTPNECSTGTTFDSELCTCIWSNLELKPVLVLGYVNDYAYTHWTYRNRFHTSGFAGAGTVGDIIEITNSGVLKGIGANFTKWVDCCSDIYIKEGGVRLDDFNGYSMLYASVFKYGYYPTEACYGTCRTVMDSASFNYGGYGVLINGEGYYAGFYYCSDTDIHLENTYCDSKSVLMLGYLAVPLFVVNKDKLLNNPITIDIALPAKQNQRITYVKQVRTPDSKCQDVIVEENSESSFSFPSDEVCISAAAYVFTRPWSPNEIFELNTIYDKKFLIAKRCISSGQTTSFTFNFDSADINEFNAPFELVIVLYISSNKYQVLYSLSPSCYYNTASTWGTTQRENYLSFYQFPSTNILFSISLGNNNMPVEFNEPLKISGTLSEGVKEYGTCNYNEYVYTCGYYSCSCWGYRSHTVTLSFNYVYQGSIHGPSVLSKYLVEGNKALFVN